MIDCVIKLGGAAITVKDQLETLQLDTITRVAGLISTLQSCGKRLVVVHGAGSFGHQHAAEAGLGKCKRETHFKPSPQKTENVSAGVAATRLALMKLHQIVLSELVSRNVSAVGISPFASGMSYSNTTEDASIFSYIKKLVQLGLVPVLHGDIILDDDTSTGFSILGGDVIMTQLCRQLKPRVAVFMVCFVT
jgi:isopentenyl phosphate kinase